MKIYFACSITGGRDFESTYQVLTRALLEDGHEVPTAHLAESNVVALERVADAHEIYQRDVTWIRSCDLLIAEVSVPSHGVGYEIGYALEHGKRVLCLAKEDLPVSKMITGNPHPALRIDFYSENSKALEKMRAFIQATVCE